MGNAAAMHGVDKIRHYKYLATERSLLLAPVYMIVIRDVEISSGDHALACSLEE